MSSLPKTSKAAILSEYCTPNTIQDVVIPKVEPKGILTKVLLAGICGSDVHQRAGALGNRKRWPLPCIQGHEVLGEIIEMGGERTTDAAEQPLKVGDRIMWAHAYCGECYACKILKKPFMCGKGQSYGFSPPDKLCGGFSEYEYVLPKADVVRVPDSLTDEEALGVGCAFRSVINGYEKLFDHGGIRAGDTVVVQGAGPIGLYATVLAAQSGAAKVIVIGAPSIRLEMAKKWGATDVVSIEEFPDVQKRNEIVMELTGGRGAQVVIEAAGIPSAFVEGVEMLSIGGIFLVLGQSTPGPVEFIPNSLLRKQAVILGSGGADISHYYKALKFIERYRDKYPFAELINRTYKLEEINEALDNMGKGVDIKAAIDNRNR